jgi:nucleoside-diphosphate-sugar epimerase
MNVLITGAAGNLGSSLAKHLLPSGHALRLMAHQRPIPLELLDHPQVSQIWADLAEPDTLDEACRGIEAVVHFAGVLFRPRPEGFLPRTNTRFAASLVQACLRAGVRRFVLVSFPHVEGPSDPARPATGRLDASPESVHAQTRLAAEQGLFAACQGTKMSPVVLRPGMIYGRGVLMIDAARWLASRRMLGVWRQPTWIHLLALPDFLRAAQAAVERPGLRGVYNLGDERPMTLQAFLDEACTHWGVLPPWRAPAWSFMAAGAACEAAAWALGTRSPLTRDFIRIGRVSYTSDTSRMRRELLPDLLYPSFAEGIGLL